MGEVKEIRLRGCPGCGCTIVRTEDSDPKFKCEGCGEGRIDPFS